MPLTEVTSWVDFVRLLVRAGRIQKLYKDDILTLVNGTAIDTFMRLVSHAASTGKETPAMASAALKDAAEDLQSDGLHVLVGRFMGRGSMYDCSYERVSLSRVLQVHIRREREDLGHTVDRSKEPLQTSEDEENWGDDGDMVGGWLDWEGKPRLAGWSEE